MFRFVLPISYKLKPKKDIHKSSMIKTKTQTYTIDTLIFHYQILSIFIIIT